MIELDNKTSLHVDEQFLNKIALKFTNKEIELIIVSKDEMREINNQHRDIDSSTDVLSFPYEDMPMSPLGTIVISVWHVQTISDELGHTSKDELTLLFIHGLLHLMGFDHEVDNGEMREQEAKLITEFKLPKSLIIRTQG